MTDIEECQKLAVRGKDYEYGKEVKEQLESQKDQIKELKQQLSEMDAVANAHAYAIMDVKRRILDELYKFPVLELLDVLLELQQREARKGGAREP